MVSDGSEWREACSAADAALAAKGIATSPGVPVGSGVANYLVCYEDLGVVARVSPRNWRNEARRGYAVAQLAGDVALSPQTMSDTGGLLVAWFTLGVPSTSGHDDWVLSQRLVAKLHETPIPQELGLGRVSVTAGLAERIPSIARGVYCASARVLVALIEHLEGLIARLPVQRPLVLCHGDMYVGQMVRVAGEGKLIDFDRAGLGDAELDWARIWSWFAAGLLPDETFADAWDAAGENLRIGRVRLYGQAMGLRNVIYLMLNNPGGARGEMAERLSNWAKVAGLDAGLLSL